MESDIMSATEVSINWNIFFISRTEKLYGLGESYL